MILVSISLCCESSRKVISVQWQLKKLTLHDEVLHKIFFLENKNPFFSEENPAVLRQLLIFATAYSQVPCIPLNPEPSVHFRHAEDLDPHDRTAPYPLSNTCAHTLHLPVGYADYATFKKNVVDAVKNVTTFTNAWGETPLLFLCVFSCPCQISICYIKISSNACFSLNKWPKCDFYHWNLNFVDFF